MPLLIGSMVRVVRLALCVILCHLVNPLFLFLRQSLDWDFREANRFDYDSLNVSHRRDMYVSAFRAVALWCA